MSTRVLATDEARTTITQLQAVLNGNLEETLAKLGSLGTRLSDPNVWDGQLATTFRSNTWPQTSQALRLTADKLKELHQQLNQIQADIYRAGGNAV
jgi:uncharacterized protein YukE